MGDMRLCVVYRHEKGHQMKTIEIHNQDELDALPDRFDEMTVIRASRS